jgi:hypothetical protein
MVTGWIVKHCTFAKSGTGTLEGLSGGLIERCLVYRTAAFIEYCSNIIVNNCIFINSEQDGKFNPNCVYTNCVMQNCWAASDTDHINCIMRNFGNVAEYNVVSQHILFKNCDLKGADATSPVGKINNITFKDCIFRNNDNLYSLSPTMIMAGLADIGKGYLASVSGNLYNCTFESSDIGNIQLESIRNPKEIIESFDHNRVLGNYKSWMKGGKIETQFINSIVQPGHLIFTPQDANNPVFKDYHINLSLKATAMIPIILQKTDANILTKLQIIDPANDPLIDSSATPLQEVTAQNNIDSQVLRIGYRGKPLEQVILRVLVQGASGTVDIDTRFISRKFNIR